MRSKRNNISPEDLQDMVDGFVKPKVLQLFHQCTLEFPLALSPYLRYMFIMALVKAANALPGPAENTIALQEISLV